MTQLTTANPIAHSLDLPPQISLQTALEPRRHQPLPYPLAGLVVLCRPI